MPKATPGPWFIHPTSNNMLCIRSTTFGESGRGEKTDLIATITLNAITPERPANARLLASAPDLLKSLKWAVSLLHEHMTIKDITLSTGLKQAKAAIADAEGKR